MHIDCHRGQSCPLRKILPKSVFPRESLLGSVWHYSTRHDISNSVSNPCGRWRMKSDEKETTIMKQHVKNVRLLAFVLSLMGVLALATSIAFSQATSGN